MSGSESRQFELIFEGPRDGSPDTLRKLRAAFIAELEFSIDDTINALRDYPLTLKRADSAAALEQFYLALQRAGGTVLVAETPIKPPPHNPTPSQTTESLATLEFWAPESPAPSPSDQHQTAESAINCELIEMEDSVSVPPTTLERPTGNAITPSPTVETAIFELDLCMAPGTAPAGIAQAPSASAPSQPLEHAEFDYTIQPEAVSTAQALAGPTPQRPSPAPPTAECAPAIVSPRPSAPIPREEPVLIVYPDKPNRLWWLPSDVLISIAVGTALLAGLNWWFLSAPASEAPALKAAAIPGPLQETPPVAAPSTEPLARATTQRWHADTTLASAAAEIRLVTNGGAVEQVSVSILPPPPEALTKEEVAQGKPAPAWVRRIELDGLKVSASPAGDFEAAGAARLSIEALGSMQRQVVHAQVSGRWSPANKALTIRLQAGNFAESTNWVGPVALEQVLGAGFRVALLAEQSLVLTAEEVTPSSPQ